MWDKQECLNKLHQLLESFVEKSYDIRAKFGLLLVLVALPLMGIVAAKKAIAGYLEFPPLTRYVQHAGFSWPVFIGLAAAILAVITPFVVRILRHQIRTPAKRDRSASCPAQAGSAFRIPHSAFPWWGRLGFVLMAVAWFMAWTRFSWFAPLQVFAFTPIWLGYILVVNGLTYRRTGHCILRDRPVYLLCLFLISAVFWWYFEYLNRFVQNWCYVGMDGLSRLEYFIFATLPFSTVMPAVLSTNELLASMPRVSAGLDDFIKIRIRNPKIPAWLSLAAFCASLAAIGVWTDYLFPLLWVSPLFIITSLQAIRGERTIFSSIATGNWRNIYLLALSALICGFFWEMWNYHSLAKWTYAIPFVNRFRVFEMPVLGYSGYLPFGLECAVVAEFIMKRRNFSNYVARNIN